MSSRRGSSTEMRKSGMYQLVFCALAMSMNDRTTVRIVVGGLAMTLLVCVLGAILLTAMSDEVPDLLKEGMALSGGALAGILARTHTEPEPAANAAHAAE